MLLILQFLLLGKFQLTTLTLLVLLVNTAVSPTLEKSSYVDASQYLDDLNMPALEDITYSDDEEDVGPEADFTNLETTITVSPIPTTRVHKDHLVTQIIGDLSSATQIRSITRVVKDQGGLTQINNEDFHTCMFACFLSQKEHKMVHQALKDPSWIKAMQEELLQFKMQKVSVLVDLPNRKKAITRIEAIRLFLAYASFIGFMVYQMDVKSAFLYGTIKEEVYVCQPLGFEDPDYPDKAWERYKDLLRACPHNGFTKLHQLDTFYNALNPADQDSLNDSVGGNLLENSPQDALTIIENKSKVRNSRSKPIASKVKAYDINSSSEIAKLTHAVNQQTSVVTTAMTAMLKQLQATPPPAPVKAVEEICIFCGAAETYPWILSLNSGKVLPPAARYW
nr:putative ribonuclease H-like domain-containing protein [Tanacetum cinerariifolium]